MIFAAGLLCGTPATGCNRTIVTTISPQTELMAFSMMGGFFAPELKYAGYDKVIFRGKSPELVYLYIHNDKVELRDATHLKGKGAVETAELIRQELKEPRAQVAAIGLAGENRVYFASIEQGRSSASRAGIGAVMGDKGLKAIVVRGTKDISVAEPAEYMQLCNEVLEYIKFRNENPVPGVMPILAGLGSPQEMKVHDEKWHTENFAWGNSRLRRKDFWNEEVAREWTETLDTMRTRLISCYNCPMTCGATISPPGMPTYMMKCFSKLTYTMAAISDLEFGLGIAQKRHRVRAGRLLGSPGHGLRPRAPGGRHPDRRRLPRHARGQRGPVLLAARPHRPPRGHRRRPGQRHLLGGQADRQGRGGVRAQQHQEAPSSCRSSSPC